MANPPHGRYLSPAHSHVHLLANPLHGCLVHAKPWGSSTDAIPLNRFPPVAACSQHLLTLLARATWRHITRRPSHPSQGLSQGICLFWHHVALCCSLIHTQHALTLQFVSARLAARSAHRVRRQTRHLQKHAHANTPRSLAHNPCRTTCTAWDVPLALAALAAQSPLSRSTT